MVLQEELVQMFKDEKLTKIMQERYIHTAKNQSIWDFYDKLIRQYNLKNPRTKAMGALTTGYPDAGKSTCCRQYIQNYHKNELNTNKKDILFHITFGRSKLKGELARLCRKTLKIADVPENPGSKYPTWLLVDKAASKLKKDGTKILFIDEVQKLFKLSEGERLDILEAWHDLINASNVSIILVGVDGINEILDVEKYEDYETKTKLKKTFCSRFKRQNISEWEDPYDEEFISFLMTIYNQSCYLTLPNGELAFYKKNEMRELIIELTQGLTAKIIDLVKWAAYHIIDKELPEIITEDILKQISKDLQLTEEG